MHHKKKKNKKEGEVSKENAHSSSAFFQKPAMTATALIFEFFQKVRTQPWLHLILQERRFNREEEKRDIERKKERRIKRVKEKQRNGETERKIKKEWERKRKMVWRKEARIVLCCSMYMTNSLKLEPKTPKEGEKQTWTSTKKETGKGNHDLNT